MSDKFKTPLAPNTARVEDMCTPVADTNSERSDSEESVSSTASGSSCSTSDLSLVAMFDDLMRLMRQQRSENVEDCFLQFAEDMKCMWKEWQTAVIECRRLQEVVDRQTYEISDLERGLKDSRLYLDKQKHLTKVAEHQRSELEMQILQIKDIFKLHESSFPSETKEKLNNSLFNSIRSMKSHDYHNRGPLSAIQEINSTGSILSDFSVSKSEDNLDDDDRRLSVGDIGGPSPKKRRSSTNKVIEVNASDTVRATTTLSVPRDGPITATSIIESVPSKFVQLENSTTPSAPPANRIFESWGIDSPRRSPGYKQHVLQQKAIVMPDHCLICDKRIKFARTALKCKECKILCHIECKHKLPLPCVPVVTGTISDYTPLLPPRVPAILIHCVNQIELKGLNELGLYRIPGSERDVKTLKEKFLKSREIPSLDQEDIHVICGTVKDFLRGLHEPIVTYNLWKHFIASVKAKNKEDTVAALYQTISQLPEPNRDTLAYMMLHLQRIAKSPECKMPVSNLAKVFGPTIVGYSSDNPDPHALLNETKLQLQVMEALILLPSEYWYSFINVQHITPNTLRQTPSTDSLLRTTTQGGLFATPARATTKRKQKFFATPPFLHN